MKNHISLLPYLMTLILAVSCQDDSSHKSSDTAATGQTAETAEVGPLSADANAPSLGNLTLTFEACQTFRDCKEGGVCVSASVDDSDGLFCAYVGKESNAEGLSLDFRPCACSAGRCTQCMIVTGPPRQPYQPPVQYLPVNPVNPVRVPNPVSPPSSPPPGTGPSNAPYAPQPRPQPPVIVHPVQPVRPVQPVVAPGQSPGRTICPTANVCYRTNF